MDREQIPQSERIKYDAIGRAYENLMDNYYVIDASIPKYSDTGEVALRSPGSGQLPVYTERLHSLMNLNEIPIKEIEKTFSLWHVKRKESE